MYFDEKQGQTSKKHILTGKDSCTKGTSCVAHDLLGGILYFLATLFYQMLSFHLTSFLG
jgi:hypothetical protein